MSLTHPSQVMGTAKVVYGGLVVFYSGGVLFVVVFWDTHLEWFNHGDDFICKLNQCRNNTITTVKQREESGM